MADPLTSLPEPRYDERDAPLPWFWFPDLQEWFDTQRYDLASHLTGHMKHHVICATWHYATKAEAAADLERALAVSRGTES